MSCTKEVGEEAEWRKIGTGRLCGRKTGVTELKNAKLLNNLVSQRPGTEISVHLQGAAAKKDAFPYPAA